MTLLASTKVQGLSRNLRQPRLGGIWQCPAMGPSFLFLHSSFSLSSLLELHSLSSTVSSLAFCFWTLVVVIPRYVVAVAGASSPFTPVWIPLVLCSPRLHHEHKRSRGRLSSRLAWCLQDLIDYSSVPGPEQGNCKT